MTPITSRDLNRFLVFLNRKRSQFMAARLAGSDLTGPMYSFLLCLEKTPGIRQDFFCTHFSMDKGTVARLCKRMEHLALIRRLVCPDDRRAYQLSLTETGRAMLKVIHEHLNDWSEQLFVGFSEADRKAVFEMLSHMAENVKDS
ncbi:MAG: MarR family winged helix-turn-helix transcriptional regulator [Saccharofermentanales bacterium]|jgi:MarR family transcriptional regulator for hemolysin|nr:winged helix-turn-helix transcriptional regulator [Clostridiaceae bacterium]